MSDPAQHFRDLLRRDRIEAVLEGLFNFICELEANPALGGLPFPYPWLDEICEETGDASAFELMTNRHAWTDSAHDVVLITETGGQGGHAEIIRDLADLNERPLVIVVTDLFRRRRELLPELARHERVVDVVRLDDATLLGRLRAAQAMLANPAARRVLVLCHGPDSVAIAAAAAVRDKPVLFFHHCDHTPHLGSFMRHAVHIDLHNLGFAQCRMQLGIENGYVCMTSREGKVTRAQGHYADPCFKSATCGNEAKLTSLPYPITYSTLVTHRIRALGGLHYHIGRLSDEFVAAVRGTLEADGLQADAFVHVGHVAGFREIAEALEIDLYIPTLPFAGGKALIDAMAAGVPILVHENAVDRLWGSRDLAYPEAAAWSTLAGLDESLARFAAADYWRGQAITSRAWFDQHHARALFARGLAANGSLPGVTPPALQPWRPGLVERLRATSMSAQGNGT